MAVGSHSGRIHVWNVESQRQEHSFETDGAFVTDVAFVRPAPPFSFPFSRSPTASLFFRLFHWLQDPSGARVAGVSKDGVLSLFDVESGALLSRVEAHTRTCRCVRFAPSGRQLFTGADDGRINVFDWCVGAKEGKESPPSL